jgi:myo-inositol-1(or 4)-monophosphatase
LGGELVSFDLDIIKKILQECSKLGYTLRQVTCTNQKLLNQVQGFNAYGERSLTIDLLLEDICVNFFRDIPHIQEIHSEESGCIKFNRGQYKVVLDPLDGTKNFNMGISYYACAVAILNETNTLIASYVVNLASGHEFKAIKGHGSFRQDVSIQTINDTLLQESDGILVGLSIQDSELKVIKKIITQMKSYRALGCASLDLCCLASGKAAVFVDLSNTAKLVDILASSLILQEAGGFVTDLTGKPIADFTLTDKLEEVIFKKEFRTIAASGQNLHTQLINLSSSINDHSVISSD